MSSRESVWAADQAEQRTVEAEDDAWFDGGRGLGDSDGPSWLDLKWE